jgi:hypothetical protein
MLANDDVPAPARRGQPALFAEKAGELQRVGHVRFRYWYKCTDVKTRPRSLWSRSRREEALRPLELACATGRRGRALGGVVYCLVTQTGDARIAWPADPAGVA